MKYNKRGKPVLDTLKSAKFVLEGGTPVFDKINLRKERRQTVGVGVTHKFGAHLLKSNNESFL
jgi:hypothetical protein